MLSSWRYYQCSARLSPGLNPINKTILRILKKISDFWKFPQIFKLSSYQNFQREFFRNLSNLLHQNTLFGNFSDFLKKLVGSKFSNFCQKISQNSDFSFLLSRSCTQIGFGPSARRTNMSAGDCQFESPWYFKSLILTKRWVSFSNFILHNSVIWIWCSDPWPYRFLCCYGA